MTLRFKVQKKWLEQKGYTTEDVLLLRYSDNGITEEIKPQLKQTDMDYYYFEAKSNGFSTYTIIAKKDNIEEVIEEEVKEEQNTQNEVTEKPVSSSPDVTENNLSQDKPSIIVTIGKILLGLLLLIGFLWFIK